MAGASERTALAGLLFSRETIHQTIPQRFVEVAAHFADRIALTGDGRSRTYAELNRDANRMAHAVQAKAGAGPGCVAFLVEQSPEMVIATLAILKAGKTYLGVHPGMPAAAQRGILEDAAPDLMLASPALAQRAREIAAGICTVLPLNDIVESSTDDPRISVQPDDPSTIFYTSGTTGHPKGVVKSHRAVLHRVWLSTQHDFIVPEDRQSLLTHGAFSASESDMFGVLLQGGTLCVFDVAAHGLAEFRSWIDQQSITLLHPPVLLFRGLLASLEGSGLFPSVRLVALAGDVVLPADLIAWRRHFAPSCVLLHRFSTAETALLTVARFDRDSVLDAGVVRAGRPVADKAVSVVDEHGRAVAPGETGELQVRSRYIADGYWRHPEEGAAAFSHDASGERVYRTGDLARFEADGSLVFLGRREHLAKIRGFRVDTREVESALAQTEAVAAAAVIVRKERDADQLWAFVVMKPGSPFDARGIRERLRAQLPEWKIPARFESLPALPITLNGKADRQALAKLADHVREKPSGAGTSGSMEDELADIWRVSLRLDDVGLDEHFLDLGGDSISAMVTLNWIERLYGIRLTSATFFQHATIRKLAALLADKPHGAAPAAAVETVADGFLELLHQRGVEYIFINPGTDTAPILEAVAKRKVEGAPTPEVILCLHESVALAAAHGHFMVSGRPQVVMVHVDVGTQNLGANLHNAQRGRAGVVICAGRAPYTFDGMVAGGGSRYNHWIQEQYNQSGSVQEYVKWRYELTRAENLPAALERAFQLAAAEPAGPAYLTLPREVLLEKIDREALARPVRALSSRPAADSESLSRAARWLMDAKHPLILTAYAGRKPEAVSALVRLAETLAAPVIETRHRVSFPSSHPLHLGFAPARYLQEADCILVVDHDVPWVPAQAQPSPGTRVIHIDIDPLKRDIPLWGFPVDLAIHADATLACSALAQEIERQWKGPDRERIEIRRRALSTAHHEQSARLEDRALQSAPRRPIAPEWAARCLNEIVDKDTVIVSEAVSNSPVLWNYLQLDVPGSYFQSLGSGLGWGLGASMGAKLADPSKTVICIVGDGSWLFSSPLAAYLAAGQRSPFLTVIFNNQEYFSTTEAILGVAPEGHARQSGYYPACDLPKPPLFAKIGEALGLWTRTVEDPATLTAVLREALAEVRTGRSALVDICVSSPRPVDRTEESPE